MTSKMSGGGLKIIYEKQDAVTTKVDMDLDVLRISHDTRSKRRKENGGLGEKRSSRGTNGIVNQLSKTSISSTLTTRSSRSRNSTPQQDASSSITHSQISDSASSSPSSESQSAVPLHNGAGKSKNRKSAPSALAPSKTKDVKLFQNGVTAPHMLGNQLNPNSKMAKQLSAHLNSELEAHSIFTPDDNSNMVGPQLHHKVIASARPSSTSGSSTSSAGSGFSAVLGGGAGNLPESLEQLLERQWEQGSEYLMEQAQHFDIASLLSCLHQLREENLKLEEHVRSLNQRRNHLLAVNTRLAISLTSQPATSQSSHAQTAKNIQPAVGASRGDVPMTTNRHSRRFNGNQKRPGCVPSVDIET